MKSATASEDLSSCLIHYSNQDCQVQGNQFVDSLVMQACVTAAHSQDPGDPSVLVIMCGAPISQLPPAWHLMPPLTPGVMKNINFVYPQNSKVPCPFHYVCYQLILRCFLSTNVISQL